MALTNSLSFWFLFLSQFFGEGAKCKPCLVMFAGEDSKQYEFERDKIMQY